MSLIKIAFEPERFRDFFSPQALKTVKNNFTIASGSLTGTAGAALGAGAGAFRQHQKNKKLDPSERQSVGKAALKGGAIGAGVGTVTGAVGGRVGFNKVLNHADKHYQRLPREARRDIYLKHLNRTKR